MSKNRRHRLRKENVPNRSRRYAWRRIALLISIMLIFSGVIVAGMGRGAGSTTATPPTSGVNLVKQYVYVGGRLAATKEP